MNAKEFVEQYKGRKAIWKLEYSEMEGTIIGDLGAYENHVKFLVDGYNYAADNYHMPKISELIIIPKHDNNKPLPLPG